MTHALVGSMADGPAYYRDAAVRGNYFKRQYVCKNADGTPADLTGFRARWRAVYGDYTLAKSTEDGSLTLTTPTNGTIGLSLTPEETRLIPAEENMKYELELFSDTSQETVLCGDLVGKEG